jgi:hypothetical protein
MVGGALFLYLLQCLALEVALGACDLLEGRRFVTVKTLVNLSPLS